MNPPRKRALARALAFAVALTVAPVAFGSVDNPGVKLNDACARDGKCCWEINSFCDERTLDYFYSFGSCPWV